VGNVKTKYAKDGSPLYYAHYKTPGGRWKWEAGGRLKKNADALLRRREREIAEGTYGLEVISFEEFSRKWLKDYAGIKVKPQTHNDYEGVIRKHLNPFFGESLLRDITPARVQEYVTDKAESGLSPRTINKTLTVLKMMLKHAVIWGYLKENPARFVERPREKRKEMDYLTPEEVRRLLGAASPEFRPLFSTAVLTGARQGELLALRWGDVDLEQGIVYVRRSYHPEHGFVEPKSARGSRAIFMSPELVRILRSHKASTNGSADRLVFPNTAGKPMLHQNMVRREFHPALERAGLKRVRFHDLRHTYAAMMISLGENIKFIQTQMGHSSISTTLDRYGHLLPEASEGVGGRLDNLVFS
jgi:integrase